MRKISLTSWIIIAMIAGIAIGLLFHFNAPEKWIASFSDAMSLLTEVFLRLIKMIIAPLVFSTLVVGIAKLGDIKSVGRIGGKTLLWFMSMSLLSLVLGLVIMNILKLGHSINLPLPDAAAKPTVDQSSLSFKNFVEHVFPESIIQAMASNQILQIVAFSVFFGIATAAIGEQGKIITKALDAVAHVVLKMTGYVMKLAPAAAFAAIAAIVAIKGPDLLFAYGKLIISFYAGIICLWGLLILISSLFIGKRAIELISRVKAAVLLAFSTASSESAFPQLLTALEEFGCPNKIVSFVLPLGYSFNLDGSMLYMTFASLFIAQAYGMHMSVTQQISMLLVLMLTSKGIAGVPRASLVVIAGTLSMFNIPQQGLLLLLGIDQVLDMARSATNVVGNSLATAVVSKMEGAIPKKGS
ncbi:MAG: dicarboxylate/amino acid:cation symporter [Bacteroidetes bacterium]|nr:dicarboxylate/amino acid:cation symporter [Bacteroidota bacterium]MBS1973183.1 dicarboxylate/amino acid:cation symporter [Bacteroidota bacterium]